MKRVAQESLDQEVPNKVAKSMFNVFAIVYGPITGLFDTWEDVTRVNGHKKGSVYKRFGRRSEAEDWFDASLCLPRYGPNVKEIHVSAVCYDYTQDKDFYAAVAIYFGNNDVRNISLPARVFNTHIDKELCAAIFKKALDMITETPVRIVCDSYSIVYGLNYGLWNWPKRDISAPPTEELRDLQKMVIQRNIEVAWSDGSRTSNMARRAARACCGDQHDRTVETFEKKEKVIRKQQTIDQCVAWILCGKRMGLYKDIRNKIAKIIFKRNYGINEIILF
jgi:hypothetical protein